VLVNSDLFPKPLTESLDIAKFFISRYPSLSAPVPHLQEAEDLLDELHDLDYFTLSFAHVPIIPETTMKSCEQRLAAATSQRHREALEAKMAVCVTLLTPVQFTEPIKGINLIRAGPSQRRNSQP
jgi:hypothetical protein